MSDSHEREYAKEQVALLLGRGGVLGGGFGLFSGLGFFGCCRRLDLFGLFGCDGLFSGLGFLGGFGLFSGSFGTRHMWRWPVARKKRCTASRSW